MAFEGALNKIIGFGLAADRPVTPALAPGQLGIYVSTDTGAADYWYAGAWHDSLDGAATATQGALADTAVQPGDLAPVAISGSYNDLSDKPAGPTAYTDEMAQDAFAALIAAGTLTGIAATYDDAGNAIGFTVTGGGGASNTVTALTISTGSITIDCSLGNYFTLAMTANVTSVNFSNLPAAGTAQTIMVRITQDGTGNRTMTMPSSFDWASGATGALSTAANAKDVLALTTFNQGDKWEATLSKAHA